MTVHLAATARRTKVTADGGKPLQRASVGLFNGKPYRPGSNPPSQKRKRRPFLAGVFVNLSERVRLVSVAVPAVIAVAIVSTVPMAAMLTTAIVTMDPAAVVTVASDPDVLVIAVPVASAVVVILAVTEID